MKRFLDIQMGMDDPVTRQEAWSFAKDLAAVMGLMTLVLGGVTALAVMLP